VISRFERPESIAGAARLLASCPWVLLAGGTDLYPAHVGRPIAGPVLDLGAIAALRGIRHDDVERPDRRRAAAAVRRAEGGGA
jgi:CO/xanthine dehydrogenase FAD-binding subunit